MIIGLICTFLSGIFTIFFGAVFKHVGSKYDFKTTMLLYAVLTTIVCGICTFFEPGSWGTYALLPFLCSFLSGAINISGLTILQKAMSLGNAGVAWAFCQAGLLGPFVFSIVVYGERPSILQYVGAVVIVLGMIVLSGNDSENDQAKKKSNLLYLFCAFMSFLCACANGSLVIVVSKIAPDFSITVRMFVMYIGTAFMLAVLKIIAKSYRIEVNKGVLASTVALTLLGLGCCVFMFIGSNALANVNMASIAIPILQGTAIGGFALYGALVLKEKSSLIKWGGIVAIILGIIFMSL